MTTRQSGLWVRRLIIGWRPNQGRYPASEVTIGPVQKKQITSDPSAVARVQALSARIWSDWCSGCLALYTYQAMPSKEYPQPLARGAGVEVLPALIASEVEEIQLSVA